MKAAVARAGVVSLETMPDVTPGAGQVVVAPIACGICGSDTHLLHTQRSMPDLVGPIVLGHEFVGRILDFGPDTQRGLVPGTVVTSVPYLDTPSGPQLVGLSPDAAGALAEQVVLQESRLIAVPPAMSPEVAALTEPVAVGIHAVAAAELSTGDVSLVIGCGPVGLAVIAALKSAGVGPVVAADFSPHRRALAEVLGADVVIDPRQTSPYDSWSRLADTPIPSSPLWDEAPGRSPNTVIFECVGLPGVLNTVMESAVTHSRIVVVGVCQQPDTILPALATVKELTLRFVFAYRPHEFAQALRDIGSGRLAVEAMITSRVPLDDVGTAFRRLEPPSEECKVLVQLPG